jgi:hypothetical protein
LDTEELSCPQDGVPTRLRCAKCGKGICPTCMVRTPVGFDCPTCAGTTARTRRRRPPGVVLVGGAAVAVVLLVGLNLTRSSSGETGDPVEAGAAAAVVDDSAPRQQAMIGEEARDGQLAFVVNDFSCAPKSTTGQLCRLQFTVKNVSGGPAMFLGKFQYLVDGQQKFYGADSALSGAVPENDNRSIDELNVNPDVVVPLVLVFDLPETVSPTEARFKGTGRSRFGVDVRLERRS